MHAVLNWLWQGATVAVALFVMLPLLEHTRANIRYIVCSLALLIVLAIPVLWSQSPTDDVPQSAAQSMVGPAIPVPATGWVSTALMLGLWSLWAGAQGLRMSRALLGLRRARQTCHRFPTDVEQQLRHWTAVRDGDRRARLVLSDAVGWAAVLGCGKPLIAVAPALVERLSADELDHVIIHEWAHVQRRDDLANLLLLSSRVVAGWHPAVWWIDRRLQVEREIACDEMTVAVTGSAKSYASCLVKLADLSAATPVLLGAPGVLTAGGLRRRVIRIVSGRPFSSTIWSRGLGIAVVAALLTLATGVGSFELFVTVLTPRAPARTTTISRPLESIPTPRLNLDPIPRSLETRTRNAAVSRRDPRTAPRAPVQSTEILPVEASSLSPPIAQPPEPGDRQIQVETPEAVAPEASSVAGDAPMPGTAGPPVTNGQPDSRPPWVVASDAGVAIGRGSRAAGLATAGFFTRFARRVAGSF